MSDHSLYAAEGVVFACLLGSAVTWLVARVLRRGRPGLDLARPLLTAFVVRVLAAAALALTSLGSSIRGGDEPGFVFFAHYIARQPFLSHDWIAALIGHFNTIVQGAPINLSGTLQLFVMASQVRLFNASEFAMRTTMASISVVGLGLVAAAVYQLAGPRRARLTAWVLAFEPANIFFSTMLHKEPVLFLATGLVVFGAARLWRRVHLAPLLMMVAGCLIAAATRPYVGWFLGAACVLVMAHAALRAASSRKTWAIALAISVTGVVAVAAPAIVRATSKEQLTTQLQSSQNANASDNSNLKLAPVDFSSRGAIVRNLPRRMFDLVFRPFPWQVGDASQGLGVIETFLVLGMVALLVGLISRGIRGPLGMGAPVIYPALMLLIAYSLAVGNAGTGFRYRTQIVILLIPIIVILRARLGESAAKPAQVQPGAVAVGAT